MEIGRAVFMLPILLTGCASLLGKDEPGTRVILKPMAGQVEIEDTSDKQVELQGFLARWGDGNEISAESLLIEQKITEARLANAQQMAQAVESHRIATDALANFGNTLVGAIVPMLQQRFSQRAEQQRFEAEQEALTRQEVIDIVRQVLQQQPTTRPVNGGG